MVDIDGSVTDQVCLPFSRNKTDYIELFHFIYIKKKMDYSEDCLMLDALPLGNYGMKINSLRLHNGCIGIDILTDTENEIFMLVIWNLTVFYSPCSRYINFKRKVVLWEGAL